ncbi:MAG: DUF3108 domain-containing protein [Pseudomonadota bacterium]
MAIPGRSPLPGHRPGFWLLAAGVGLAHLLLADRLAQDRVGWGAGDAPPPRIEVTFVRELAAAAPPAVVAPVAVAPPRLAAVAAKPRVAASAPELPASVPDAAEPAPPPPVLAVTEPEPPPLPAPVPEPTPDAVQRAAAAAEAAPATSQPAADAAPPAAAAPALAEATPAAPAASAVVFEWPPSTRLSYKLLGDYRGPVEGTAQVDWLRQGSRYQVHLSTSIGPVLSRHITSEGELTAQGLAPRRFDGEQKVVFRSPRRWQLRFGPEQVVLSDGKTVPTQPGAQDEASQFVQLTWLFTTQPQKLKVGGAVEMPLAISRKLERWIYDVRGEELLRLPFGEVPTFHLKPRREAASGDLTPEIWIAPSLQYLPVRIMIRDSQGNWIDLTLEKPPLQAAPAK